MAGNEDINSVGGNTIILKFADCEMPEFKEVRGEEFVRFGVENNYPNYLIKLYDKSSKHAAIINGKVSYIFGNGLKEATTTPGSSDFIDKYNNLVEKSVTDIEAAGGFYWQVIPNRLGTAYYLFHVAFEKIRSNKAGTMFYFKNNWKDRTEQMKRLPAFIKGTRVSSIYAFKEYKFGSGVYALPKWWAACNYIDSDIEVSKSTLTNAKSGFSASKLITFKNGVPTTEGKRAVTNQFRNEFGGSTGEKIVIQFVKQGEEAAQIDDLGSSDLTKEDFTQVDNLITGNIFAAHSVTHPLLFGIQQAGKLGAGNELRTAYDIFKNTYVSKKQKQIEDIVNLFASYNNIGTKFTLISVDPIGLDFSDTLLLQAAPRSWLLEKLGIDPKIYTDAPIGIKNDATTSAPTAAVPAAKEGLESEVVNDNIKNLTAKQHQQLLRIIRQYSKGTITKAVASVLLKTGLGLNDADIASILGTGATFSFKNTACKMLAFEAIATDDNTDAFSDDESVAMVFAAFGESKEGYTPVLSKTATFAADEEAAITGEAAKSVPDLSATEKIKSVAKKFEVRYSYEKRAEATGAVLLPTSRQFCIKLIGLDRFYKREDIQKISAVLGYDVFLRTGGFWGKKPYCRHEFKSHVVIAKKP